jgi:hypothetical protein
MTRQSAHSVSTVHGTRSAGCDTVLIVVCALFNLSETDEHDVGGILIMQPRHIFPELEWRYQCLRTCIRLYEVGWFDRGQGRRRWSWLSALEKPSSRTRLSSPSCATGCMCLLVFTCDSLASQWQPYIIDRSLDEHLVHINACIRANTSSMYERAIVSRYINNISPHTAMVRKLALLSFCRCQVCWCLSFRQRTFNSSS